MTTQLPLITPYVLIFLVLVFILNKLPPILRRFRYRMRIKAINEVMTHFNVADNLESRKAIELAYFGNNFAYTPYVVTQNCPICNTPTITLFTDMVNEMQKCAPTYCPKCGWKEPGLPKELLPT